MEQDTNKTRVRFLIEKDSENEVFAYFPEERHNNTPKLFTCYAHIGQHSACHEDYAAECKPATREQYADLKAELESIGYNLDVINPDPVTLTQTQADDLRERIFEKLMENHEMSMGGSGRMQGRSRANCRRMGGSE